MWPFADKTPNNGSNGVAKPGQNKPLPGEPRELRAIREAMISFSPEFTYAPSDVLIQGVLQIIQEAETLTPPPVKGFVLTTSKDADVPADSVVAMGANFRSGRVCLEWADGRTEQLLSVDQLRAQYQGIRLLWYEPPSVTAALQAFSSLEAAQAPPPSTSRVNGQPPDAVGVDGHDPSLYEAKVPPGETARLQAAFQQLAHAQTAPTRSNLADICGVSPRTIGRWLQKEGIDLSPSPMTQE